MNRLCRGSIESCLNGLEYLRECLGLFTKGFCRLRNLADNGYDNCLYVRPCAGLGDLCRAGLGCALKILIEFVIIATVSLPNFCSIIDTILHAG